MTTIKVSTELRNRINHVAHERGLSAAEFIGHLIDAYERQRRMEAFGQAFRAFDAEYWDEFQSWDLTQGKTFDAT